MTRSDGSETVREQRDAEASRGWGETAVHPQRTDPSAGCRPSSPSFHRFSTLHPAASVEMRPFTLSANAVSCAIDSATLSHAYITVV